MRARASGTTEEVIIWQDRVKGLGFNQETVVLFDDAYVEG